MLDMVTDQGLRDRAQELGTLLIERNMTISCAESCTGGWLAKVFTDVVGSSAWFKCAWVTYGNKAKQDLVGVNRKTLKHHGAVSEATVAEMAEGVARLSHANISVAVSGIAGPGGGSLEKPIGTVCFAVCSASAPITIETCHFDGDREAVRRQAVGQALEMLCEAARSYVRAY